MVSSVYRGSRPLGLLVVLSTAILFRVPGPSFAQSSASPDSTDRPDGFDLQGHRGARGLAPENTMLAFRRALEIGVTTLEMDVVISKDGTVVVSHEPWMNPEICSLPSGDPVPEPAAHEHNLYRMPYAEIERYDCGQRRHPDFPRQDPEPAVKPRLRDVIADAEAFVADSGRPPVFYNIELKSRPDWDETFHPPPDAFARRVLDLVHESEVAGRTTIQAFDERALRAARQLRAERDDKAAVRLALLVGRGVDGGLADQLGRLGFTPAVYSPDHRLVDGPLLEAAEERGLRVVPWTVNERDAMRRLIRLGVDGLITDYPDVAQQVLETTDASLN